VDAGLALLDIEGSPGGPLEVVLAVRRSGAAESGRTWPSSSWRFKLLRGLEEARSEMAIQITSARTGEKRIGVYPVFSVGTRFVVPESRILISSRPGGWP